jgi:hypothetical protein
LKNENDFYDDCKLIAAGGDLYLNIPNATLRSLGVNVEMAFRIRFCIDNVLKA